MNSSSLVGTAWSRRDVTIDVVDVPMDAQESFRLQGSPGPDREPDTRIRSELLD
jgi:hypothetical protein